MNLEELVYFTYLIIYNVYEILHMTQYAGGKARLGTRISDFIFKYEAESIGHNDSPYFEPFVGMAGVMTKMTPKNKNRKYFACDLEKCIISFWREIQTGWNPPEISKELYKRIRSSGVEDAMYAFAAFGCSFKGMRWGGFYEEAMGIAKRRLSKHDFNELTSNVTFIDNCSYVDHSPSGMVIYCDPPYMKSNFVKDRKNLMDFDHVLFWETIRIWSKNNLVIVSEAEAPDDFVSIWSYERQNGINNKKPIVEHLFVITPSSLP